MDIRYYNVAELIFSIIAKQENNIWRELGQYENFEVAQPASCATIFNLVISDTEMKEPDAKYLLGSFESDSFDLMVYEYGDEKVIAFSSAISQKKVLVTFGDNGDAKIYISSDSPSELLFGVNNAVMILYTYFATPHQTLMLHSSVIVKDGKGYLFQGKSGTGKSTHSRMWLEGISQTELLNDDNPVVRIVDGSVMVYGTPWSGKTPCYKNGSFPIGAMVRIVQAPYNRIEQLSIIKSFASVLPSCSCIRWNKELIKCLHQNVEHLIKGTKCYKLEALPNIDAANVCFEKVYEA